MGQQNNSLLKNALLNLRIASKNDYEILGVPKEIFYLVGMAHCENATNQTDAGRMLIGNAACGYLVAMERFLGAESVFCVP